MTDRIDATPVRPGGPLSLPPPSGPVGTQVQPAQSMLVLAQQALGASPLSAAAVKADALAETIENIGLMLGARLREFRPADDGQVPRRRAGAILQRMIDKASAVAPVRLDELFRRGAGFEAAADPGAALRERGLDAGQAALLLAAQLARAGPGARRARLEQAQAAAMEEDGWTLQLFSYLEFGVAGSKDLAELRQLYQSATAGRDSLVGWFDGFRRLCDRQRKLRTLIRALAFELSAEEPVMGAHLAAVMADLKRILLFFGLEDHCLRIADALAVPGLDGDCVMQAVLALLQSAWIGVEGVAGHVDSLVGDARLRLRYGRQLSGLVRLLPDECFGADDQRETLQTACTGYLEWLADQGG